MGRRVPQMERRRLVRQMLRQSQSIAARTEGLLLLQASVGWGLGLGAVQPQENFNTAGSFVLNLKISWEPGVGQWLGVLEKAGSSTVLLGDGSWGPRVPLALTWGLLGTGPAAAGKSADFSGVRCRVGG